MSADICVQSCYRLIKKAPASQTPKPFFPISVFYFLMMISSLPGPLETMVIGTPISRSMVSM